MSGQSGRVTLVLGGARSGKSDWAEDLARRRRGPVAYVATATAREDAEMIARIAAHRAARPAAWRTVEEPLELARAVVEAAGDAGWAGATVGPPVGTTILVDCLTLWAANHLLAEAGEDDPELVAPARWARAEGRLLQDLERAIDQARAAGAHLILVSNEVGMGLVPPYALGRAYRDILGRVNRAAAARADDAYLMVAGLPLDLRRLVAPPEDGG